MSGPVVETASGKLEGAAVAAPDRTPVSRFLGVPYAAPPVGARRWRPPDPVTPWTGVRPALEYGPGAPQAIALESPLPGFLADASGTDEDCLTLNVWAPSEPAPTRPVLVWIPGGAFMSGGSSQAVYDAARLAVEADAVVVTINYRLGALGFMALGPNRAADERGAATNCGLRDQFAALAWVRTNAAAFGGDPDLVTVFGESAGAGSILQLLASPRRGDAFRRAVIQSCEPKVLGPDAAELVTRAFLEHLGMDGVDVDRLRELPVDALLDAQGAAFAATMVATGMMPFHPVDDGDVVDGSPVDALRAGRAAPVDLVIGTTRDELRLFPDPSSAGLERAQLVRRIGRLAGDAAPIDPEQAVDLYLDALGPGATPGDVWERVRTDTMMRVPDARGRRRAGRAQPRYVRVPLRLELTGPGRRARDRRPVHVRHVRPRGLGGGRRDRRARRAARHESANGLGRVRAYRGPEPRRHRRVAAVRPRDAPDDGVRRRVTRRRRPRPRATDRVGFGHLSRAGAAGSVSWLGGVDPEQPVGE